MHLKLYKPLLYIKGRDEHSNSKYYHINKFGNYKFHLISALLLRKLYTSMILQKLDLCVSGYLIDELNSDLRR